MLRAPAPSHPRLVVRCKVSALPRFDVREDLRAAATGTATVLTPPPFDQRPECPRGSSRSLTSSSG